VPIPLSSIAIAEKNKLATDAVWFVALEITIPGLADPVRISSNNESVTWRGETWVSFRFELAEIGEGRTGEVPRVELRVSNVDRQMEYYIWLYDSYIKSNGFTPIEVSIYVLVSKNLGSATPEAEHVYELKQPKANKIWATFILGASNPFNRRYPQHRLLKNHCRFRYNYPAGSSPLCGAPSSGYTTCDKTLTACRQRNNSVRFGGTPGVGIGGIRLA
jgi:phage-related protein